MSNYYESHSRRRRSRREKIGFYTAFSICLIAICMAVYSTYNTVVNPSSAKLTQTPTQAKQVNEAVTGVVGTLPVPTLGIPEVTEQEDIVVPTAVADLTTEPEEDESKYSEDALQTMLAADLSLRFPVDGGNVLREYSKDSVYFKTLNVWKPHTGTDFKGELGDDVYAMTGGEVTKVTDDKMYGKTVEISVNNAICIYSGLGSITVEKGEKVEAGDKIGTVGSVPFEASDENHIHVAVKVNGNYADPLNFIGNEE